MPVERVEVALGATPLPGHAQEGQAGEHGQAGRDRTATATSPEPTRRAERTGTHRAVVEEPSQILGERDGVRVSVRRRPGHRLQADRLQVARDRLDQATGRRGIVVEDLRRTILGLPRNGTSPVSISKRTTPRL